MLALNRTGQKKRLCAVDFQVASHLNIFVSDLQGKKKIYIIYWHIFIVSGLLKYFLKTGAE